MPRHALGVLAAGRGWFAGAVSVREESDTAAEVWLPASRPRPVPSASVCEEQPLRCHPAAFVLVVEKECVFRRLADERLWERPGLRCVIVTGCGFPDHATRAWLRQLFCGMRDGAPVFALTDYNPFGLAIALNYAHGSRASPEADVFNVPELTWLGLRHADLEAFALPPGGMQVASAADEAKAASLLKDPRVAADPALVFECEQWLATRRKCEIEALMGAGAGLEYLASYLEAKITAALAVEGEGEGEGEGGSEGGGEGGGDGVGEGVGEGEGEAAAAAGAGAGGAAGDDGDDAELFDEEDSAWR